MDKLVEHYGIVIGESTIRKITLEHARAIQRRSGGFPQGLPEPVGAGQQTFIAEIDGTMVPTVRNDSSAQDRSPRPRPCSGKRPWCAWPMCTAAPNRFSAPRCWAT